MFGETSTKASLEDIQKRASRIQRAAEKVECQMAGLREKNTELAKQNYELKKANKELKGKLEETTENLTASQKSFSELFEMGDDSDTEEPDLKKERKPDENYNLQAGSSQEL